jgi:hypothetical protein
MEQGTVAGLGGDQEEGGSGCVGSTIFGFV